MGFYLLINLLMSRRLIMRSPGLCSARPAPDRGQACWAVQPGALATVVPSTPPGPSPAHPYPVSSPPTSYLSQDTSTTDSLECRISECRISIQSTSVPLGLTVVQKLTESRFGISKLVGFCLGSRMNFYIGQCAERSSFEFRLPNNRYENRSWSSWIFLFFSWIFLFLVTSWIFFLGFFYFFRGFLNFFG